MSFKSSLSTALSAALFGLFVLVPVGINAQEGLSLTVDRLEYTSLHFIHQNISVKNDTSRLVRDVKVECDFFNKGELIATGFAYVENIFPGTTGFKEMVIESSDISPDRAACRIVSVQWLVEGNLRSKFSGADDGGFADLSAAGAIDRMARIERPTVEADRVVVAAMLEAFLAWLVAMRAQRLQLAIPELNRIVVMWLDVIGDTRSDDLTLT
jgi:hypothetical protein